MPAYLIMETDVHDASRYERYKGPASASVTASGGRFIARGGQLAVLEGNWQPKRLVLVEFDDIDAARRWYDSPQYREARSLREGAGSFRMVAVEGLR